jgi:protein-disulfide isomerase
LASPGAATAAEPAMADATATAALVAKPVSLPDMVLGQPKAPITIVEYFSMTCPHCAAFEENVFPMLRTQYIDTGKVRFVGREFPLDIKAAAASMLARCAAKGDASKYFAAVDMLFKQQDQLVEHTTDTLKAVGAKFGMSGDAVEACEKDQSLLGKLEADRMVAYKKLKVDATPTFFINGNKIEGEMTFEDLDQHLKKLLKE